MRLHHTARRSGFTLVELIVAAGLTVLIMAVLATGFQVGLQSLSTLKSAGDLADRLRTTETMLRFDLDAPHFDTGTNPGSLPLSHLRFDLDSTVRPAGGFFQIRQPAHPLGFVLTEGIDQDSLSSTHAFTHGLSLTVRRTGKTPGDLFAAVDGSAGMGAVTGNNPSDVAPAGMTAAMLISDWAEVHWFLDLNRPTVQNGVTTYPLCRRVRLLTKAAVGGVLPATPLAEVVSADAAGTTNTLAAIANPVNRLAPAALPNTPPPSRFGDDIVITNVVSFEVKPTGVVPGLLTWPRPALNATAFNADFPFDDLPANQTVFDTAIGGFAPAAGTPVTPARVTGVQIKIRVYDAKNKLTRQSVVTSKL